MASAASPSTLHWHQNQGSGPSDDEVHREGEGQLSVLPAGVLDAEL